VFGIDDTPGKAPFVTHDCACIAPFRRSSDMYGIVGNAAELLDNRAEVFSLIA
jgi:hypothetical protein